MFFCGLYGCIIRVFCSIFVATSRGRVDVDVDDLC